jgi:hypothetical protein
MKRLALAASVLSVALGAGWWLHASRNAPTAPAASHRPPVDRADEGRPALRGDVAAPQVAAALPGLPASAAVWDLCGIGRMPVPAGGAPVRDDGLMALPEHLGLQPTATALETMLGVWQRGSLRERAAAVRMLGRDEQGRDRRAALAQLSASGADPVVSMWAALYACASDSSCDDVPVDRWVQVEPGNAAAWLLWMQRHPARRAEGLSALLQATHFSMHEEALLALTMASVPAGLPAYLEPSLWILAIGIDAALPWPHLPSLRQLCRPPLRPGTESREVCDHLATLMTGPAVSGLPLYLGVKLAEGVGRPAVEMEALAVRLRAEGRPGQWLDPAQPLSCASIMSVRRLLQVRSGAVIGPPAAASAPPGR